MTVKELIEELQKLNPDAIVTLHGAYTASMVEQQSEEVVDIA